MHDHHREGHRSLLSVAGLVLQFAVKYLSHRQEMKVAAVCLSVYWPAQVTFVTVSLLAAAYFPTQLLHAEENDNGQFGVNCSRMLLIVVLHNTLISNLRDRESRRRMYNIT
jgi:hypothetical protein